MVSSDDSARFEALYRQHFTRVLAYALGRLEPERAKDAAAETFLVAWRRLGEVPDPAFVTAGVAAGVAAAVAAGVVVGTAGGHGGTGAGAGAGAGSAANASPGNKATAGGEGKTGPTAKANVGATAGAISVQVLAYRTAAAMTKAVSGDDGILYSQISVPPATRGVTTIKEWARGLFVREQIFGSSGALTDDFSAVVSHGQRIRRDVSYSQRVWETDSIPADQVGSLPPVAQQVVQLVGGGGGTPAGTVTAVTVAGRKLLKLTVDRSDSFSALVRLVISRLEVIPAGTGKAGTPASAGPPRTTIWIDAASYQPVRVVATSPAGQALLTVTFAMLPPTRASLAELTLAPVPAGFRPVPEPGH